MTMIDNTPHDQRDPELDELLSSLRTAEPTPAMKQRWIESLASREKKQMVSPLVRRALEWGVAAAAGFLAAVFLMHGSKNQDFVAQQSVEEITDFDATEIRLVAK